MTETETKQKKWKKRTTAGLVFLIVFAAIAVCGFIFYADIFGPTAWVKGKFLMDEAGQPVLDPESGLPIKIAERTSYPLLNTLLGVLPHVVRTVQVLFVALLALYIICAIITRIFQGTPRRVTIGRLTNSIVKVVIWVAAVVGVFAAWGVNLAALIAGAGVLALVIGLGMQSLIADVVAGVFIVCDGTLQVGDIVTIDGWRGTVQEIGIRNTKLINYSGDIRIANNSTIKVFINQSRELSYPTVNISITYEEDISRVEKLFAEHREELKARLPLVTDGPDYKGVSNLGESSVDLLFGATCKEDDFFQVQRDMRGVLRMFFMEQGVAIPFPQLDVHFDKPDEQKEEK